MKIIAKITLVFVAVLCLCPPVFAQEFSASDLMNEAPLSLRYKYFHSTGKAWEHATPQARLSFLRNYMKQERAFIKSIQDARRSRDMELKARRNEVMRQRKAIQKRKIARLKAERTKRAQWVKERNIYARQRLKAKAKMVRLKKKADQRNAARRKRAQRRNRKRCKP